MNEAIHYGWWERKRSNPWFDQSLGCVTLPRTLFHERNFTLSVAQLEEYVKMLDAEKAVIDRECETARLVWQALVKGHVLSFTPAPTRPLTLCDILEGMVSDGKFKLERMKFLLAVVQGAKNELGETVEPLATGPAEF